MFLCSIWPLYSADVIYLKNSMWINFLGLWLGYPSWENYPSCSRFTDWLLTILLLGVTEKDGTRKSPRCAAPAGLPSRHPGRPKLELRVGPSNLMLKFVFFHSCLGFLSGFKNGPADSDPGRSKLSPKKEILEESLVWRVLCWAGGYSWSLNVLL